MKTCPDCGEEMTLVEVPDEIVIFQIPFTNKRISVMGWIDEPYCMSCQLDKHQEPFKAAYRQGLQDAGDKYEKESSFY